MRHRLRRDPVERDEDRQALACCADRPIILVHEGVGPSEERLVRLLRLGRQDEDVVNLKLDFLRPADRRGGQGDVFIGRTQPETMLTQGRQVFTTGYQHNVASG
jgi:hypothetical protein